MPRQRILTPAEQQIFDAPPVLNAVERKKYDFSEEKLQDSVGLDLPKILAVDVP